jgi:glycosyltransferase involved in cell wall biosynthesis
MSTVLYIALEYPPLLTGGVHRAIRLSRHLLAHGVQPVVVTSDAPSYRDWVRPCHLDEGLQAQVADGIIIERVPCAPRPPARSRGRLSSWLASVVSTRDDVFAEAWGSNLRRALPDLIERHRPDHVLLTIPPFSLAPIVVASARRHGLPLVVDMRDAWSQWNMAPSLTYLHYAAKKRRERRVVRAARHVLCTSGQTADDLARLHRLDRGKLHVVPNGYDAAFEIEVGAQAVPSSGRFVIGYVGSFYYTPSARQAQMTPWWRKPPQRMLQYVPRREDWLYRSPYFFFRAVRHLLDRRPDLQGRLAIELVTDDLPWLREQIHQFGLEGCTAVLGRRSHEESLRFQRECDALLVTSSKVCGGADYSIAGKTFEYLQARKPIVAFACAGAQRSLLEQTGVAVLCDPDDTPSSSRRLEELIDGRVVLEPRSDFIKTLHMGNIAERVSRLLR